MKTTFTTRVVFPILTVLFSACLSRVSTTRTTYQTAAHRSARDTTITYLLPDIRPTNTTKQAQEKGGVSITAEILPFVLDSGATEVGTLIDADPAMPGFDQYEVAHLPYVTLTTENKRHDIAFRLRIRNNENVPLRLSAIGFALIIDGIQYSFPEEQIQEWNKGIVLTGFEKSDIIINGPALSGLHNAKVAYLFLNGVPTRYDAAGNVIQKNNFEWYFEIRTKTAERKSRITYTYESKPVHTEKCSTCNGAGVYVQESLCTVCSGTGRFLASACSYCGGDGRVNTRCAVCSGTGKIVYPKSQLKTTGTETWTGWKVNVNTRPAGATVSAYSPRLRSTVLVTGSNGQPNYSPVTLDWYSGKVGGMSEEQHPIIIEYQGKQVKVLPYKKTGKPSPYVQVDFRGAEPVVMIGKEVK